MTESEQMNSLVGKTLDVRAVPGGIQGLRRMKEKTRVEFSPGEQGSFLLDSLYCGVKVQSTLIQS